MERRTSMAVVNLNLSSYEAKRTPYAGVVHNLVTNLVREWQNVLCLYAR
jgi:hypothetical protein